MVTYKILIVEDDSIIAAAVKERVESWGCEAECITDFRDVVGQFVAYDPQLVLMDISLPFFNGYHWCSEIRKLSKIPIVFLSSASDNINIIMAINMGADDFITKPFDLDVLTAKVQAILRRCYDFSDQPPSHLIAHDGVVLNLNNTTISYSGKDIALSKNDFRIMQTLMQSKSTVTREALMLSLWQTDSYVDENTLTVNVTRLRKRLETIGLQDFIVTQKGIGYSLGHK